MKKKNTACHLVPLWQAECAFIHVQSVQELNPALKKRCHRASIKGIRGFHMATVNGWRSQFFRNI